MLSYNSSMTIWSENRNLLIVPRKENWSGAQIHRLIENVEKQYEVASQLNIAPEVKSHYRELFTDLIKTYGH
jgi:hypothetical protein